MLPTRNCGFTQSIALKTRYNNLLAHADVVELADTYVSEAYALQLEGSTPSVGTRTEFKVVKLKVIKFKKINFKT